MIVEPFQIKRKKTRQILVGNIPIGGLAPIAIQSMTNTHTQNVESTVAQIRGLEKAGCEIIRVAVPDQEAALAIRSIKKQISIPIIADIHFDHRLAIQATQSGADGLRINPGNIGSKKKNQSGRGCCQRQQHSHPDRCERRIFGKRSV